MKRKKRIAAPRQTVNQPQAVVWKPRFVVAAAQMQTSADLARNRRVILKQMEEAAQKHRAKLVVFPETALSGYGPTHWEGGLRALDFRALARSMQDVLDAARQLKIAVVLGTTIKEGPRYFNSALTISPNGKVVGRYDKLQLTGAANRTGDAAHFTPGGAARLKPVMVAGVKLGALICLDMRYPEIWRLLALQGARVFVHPTAAFGREGLYKIPAIRANISSRASENGCWLVHANSAGPYQFSHSCIIDPDGLAIAAAQPDCEHVIAAAIDPAWKGRNNFIAARRTDVYELKVR
ncbi:MAG: carbon-nitrogen hydrolase family protein [Planctomycetes bacterium]|nr:carbon-nitrogen hydrolase family protein [Planctomycetota bacterium]